MLFKIMGSKGDAACNYALEVAEIKFDELVQANMRPFEVVKGRGLKPMMRVFDKEAEEVTWMPQIMGG